MSDTAVFLLATLAKAWEPLAVSLASPEGRGPPFAAVLVCAEAAKLALVAPLLPPSRIGLCSRSTGAAFAPPAALLALCNHCLGFAVPRLDPLTYQVSRAEALWCLSRRFGLTPAEFWLNCRLVSRARWSSRRSRSWRSRSSLARCWADASPACSGRPSACGRS